MFRRQLLACITSLVAAASLAPRGPGKLHVSPLGDDATGRRNDSSRPYLTIRAALAAAKPGDTVWVGPLLRDAPLAW